MAGAARFFEYWGLALLSLCLAVPATALYYRCLDSDLDLHRWPKEFMIAAVASIFQGAGFWLSASLFNGDPFRRLVIPGAIAGFVYYIAHLEDWSGYEIGAITFFQMMVLVTGLGICYGSWKLTALILALCVGALVFIGLFVKRL
jgi:hypothetical protein